MTYTEFMDNIYTWISANVSITVIFADQNAPRPDEKYITIKNTGISHIGHRNYTGPDDVTEERTVKYEEEITVSIQSYGADTSDYLQQIKESLQKESVIWQFEQMKVAVRRDEPVRNVSSLIDSVIEERWSYEITFGISTSFVEEVGIIENIEFAGTYYPVV